MPQAMEGEPAIKSELVAGLSESAVEGAHGDRLIGRLAVEEPAFWPRPGGPPVALQFPEHGLGQVGHALAVALALADAQEALVAPDVRGLQRHRLADTQCRAVGHKGRHAVAHVGHRLDQVLHILFRHRPGQAVGNLAKAQSCDLLRLTENAVVKQTQRRHGDIRRARRQTTVNQHQDPVPDRVVRLHVQPMSGVTVELRNLAQIVLLRDRRQPLHRHHVERLPAQRGYFPFLHLSLPG